MYDFLRRLLFKRSPINAQTVFFGIGNIGPRYALTRHNIGFMVIDELEKGLTKRSSFRAYESDICSGYLKNGTPVIAAKPRTFVNKCGSSYATILKEFRLPTTAGIVVVDDFNLPLGSIRLRKNGSDGGHNGLKSIIAKAGSEFPRLRVGIGPKPQQSNIIDFVLGEFEQESKEILASVVSRSVNALIDYASHGIDWTMSRYNK